MAARDKPKAPAASKKGKQEKREQGEAPQPAGKPVEPETPVAQESLEPLEPPENWGSPFKPTAATTVSRAMREITLLLRIGSEQRILDVLAMPEFTVRLLWIMEKASEGKAMTIREGSMAEAAWSMLKAQTAAYMNAKLEDKTAYILNNPYGAYDPPTVSQYLENLPGIIERVGNLAYLKAEVLSEFKHWCQAVMVRNLEIFSDEDFVNEVYASGFHVVSGDGNDYWRRRWLCEPEELKRFHETFQKRCAELQEPMEAPAVGTMAPEARRGKGNRRGKRGKQFSEKCHTVMDAFFKHENLDIRPYGNRLNYLSLDSKYRKWVKGEGKTFDPRGDIEAELKEHGGSVLKEGIRFYVATWRQKRRQK